MSTATMETTAWPARTRWQMLVVAFLTNGFDAADFMLLALTLPLLIREFDLSLAEAGLLGTATLIGVGFSGVAVGWFSDVFGRKRALIACMLVFGLMTALIYFARGWLDFLVLRFIAGFGLGGVWSVVTTYVSETWPKESRSRATNLVMSAWPTGIIVAALLVGQLLPIYGWRFLFLCGGAVLLLIPYVWFAIPESPAWVAQAKAHRKGADQAALIEIFGPNLRWITAFGTLASCFALIAYWGVQTWLPTYLVKERGLTSGAMAQFVIFINIGTIVGYQFFGWLADRIGAKHATILSLFGGALMLPIYGKVSDPNILFWLGPLTFFFFAFPGLFGSFFPRLYPARVRSLGSGVCFNVGRGLSAFAPFVLGGLASVWSLSIVIGLCGLGFLCGAALVAMLPNPDKMPATAPVLEPSR